MTHMLNWGFVGEIVVNVIRRWNKGNSKKFLIPLFLLQFFSEV